MFYGYAAQKQNGTQLLDHIGRPVFATTDPGAVGWSAIWYPFGGVRVTQGTPIGLRFPGQWFQAESGLHQNWMRDYDPTTGRYIQPDPLGLIDGASVFGCALQSPMVWMDPTGGESVLQVVQRNHREMREANWRFSDKYLHCRADCQAIREFPGACYDGTSLRYELAIFCSHMRETLVWLTSDKKTASMFDRLVNKTGRVGAIVSL